MTTMTQPSPASQTCRAIGGIDTHKDTHTAAVLDSSGRMLGHRQTPHPSPTGYVKLLEWLREHGEIERVGIEGTGVYGSGVALHLQAAGVELVEVDRPDRKTCRWRGKSDPVDAEAAARAALAGRATGVPKDRTGAGRGTMRAADRPAQRHRRPREPPRPR